MTQKLHRTPILDVSAHHETDHRKVQSVLTVEQIMTPRNGFLCCNLSDRISAAFDGVAEVYDAVTIVDGDASNPQADVVGVLWRKDIKIARPLDSVASFMDERPIEAPLEHLTSMLDYARTAQAERLSFVADGTDIIGLVTIYDLERLPVRISLFQHLLYFEQRLGDAIIALAPDEGCWADFAPHKRDKIEEGIRRSASREHHGSPILGIGFTEKVEIARRLLPQELGANFKPNLLDYVAPFRNDVAHGLPFERIEDVPLRIRQIDDLLSILNSPRICPQT